MAKSTFPPHVYIPYPPGHHIKHTCMKCGRPWDHPIHKDESSVQKA